MFDPTNGPTKSLVKQVDGLSKDVAPFIAALVREHRLPAMMLLVLATMEEVREIDNEAAQITSRF